jgi:hypothetical protein
MLGDGALRDIAAAGQLDHRDLFGIDDALEHGPPRGIGKRPHDSSYGFSFDHEKSNSKHSSISQRYLI